MPPTTLIVLAGGRSTRFGRPKQLEPVGPNGEALLDLALRDAFRAGCTSAILVVRPELEAVFAARNAHGTNMHLVVQHEALGTAHAVMQALEHVQGDVLIANGDDHYGAGPLRMAIQHAVTGDLGEHALVTFELANTLSASGPVNRALCTVNAKGLLGPIEEVLGLHRNGAGTISDAKGRPFSGHEHVSMNLWLLRPSMFDLFSILFHGSVREGGEFGLPDVVRAATANGHRFRALHTSEPWCGLTYASDADLVRRILSANP